jgi:hypothetical protein
VVADMYKLLDGLNLQTAATDSSIVECEKQLGKSLPREYVEFLKMSNGGEGFLGNSYVILWRIEDLFTLNRAYEVSKYIPGLLIFGSNGGGEAYGFDTRNSQWPIVEVPFVGMDWDLALPRGRSFTHFLQYLRDAKDD